MTKKILIDALYPEETRIAILDNGKLEDFDYESLSRRSVKGNIYLGKVSNVSPSLQAAFVTFHDGKDGFLPFDQIHPDYWRIPVQDRESLVETFAEEGDEDEPGGRDEGEGAATKARIKKSLLQKYRIQEVIQKNQLVLVQVAKDERGGKGASLTTYLSFAGRYCVSMPNTPRGVVLSRRIGDAKARKHLKECLDSLNIPKTMGVIVRTAGAECTKAEIKRDFEYLDRLWGDVRHKTLNSVAPCLIHEERSLVQTALRDRFDKKTKEVIVAGAEAHAEAHDLMKQLMPSQVKNLRLHQDNMPLFTKHGLDEQITSLQQPTVHLPSGGYIVINTAEALTAIDVNSGRATRERHMEETALKTNLEAAEEIARQLRLRDLGGLIVIDFIDMSKGSHNTQVEKRFSAALKVDRARIQTLGISPLGLLELSRQRMKPSLLESLQTVCTHCGGSGHTVPLDAMGLAALREIEAAIIAKPNAPLHVTAGTSLLLHLVNHRRMNLSALEERYSLSITLDLNPALAPDAYSIGAPEDAEVGTPPAPAKRLPTKPTDRPTTKAQPQTFTIETPEGESDIPASPTVSMATDEPATAPEKPTKALDVSDSKVLLFTTRRPAKAKGQRFGHKKSLKTKPGLFHPERVALEKKRQEELAAQKPKTSTGPNETVKTKPLQRGNTVSKPAFAVADANAAVAHAEPPHEPQKATKPEAPKKAWWRRLLS